MQAVRVEGVPELPNGENATAGTAAANASTPAAKMDPAGAKPSSPSGRRPPAGTTTRSRKQQVSRTWPGAGAPHALLPRQVPPDRAVLNAALSGLNASRRVGLITSLILTARVPATQPEHPIDSKCRAQTCPS